MNTLRKVKPWVIVSLLVASSVMAGDKNMDKHCSTQKKGEPTSLPDPMQAPATAAYNAPARVDVDGWQVYTEASYIYWQPTQSNMEFAVSSTKAATSAATTIRGTTTTPVHNHMVNLNSSFKSGFEVGGGLNFDYDNWDSYLQYTWFHNTHTHHATAPTGGSLFPFRLQPGATGSDQSFDTARASWNLKMDLADWQFARSYYVGTKLTFRPYFGLRGAWIRQHYKTTYERTTTSPSTVQIVQKSTSWGLGPEAGMDASYLLGCGFRMFGDLEADLLYTRYKAKSIEQLLTSTELTTLSQGQLGTVRPHANLDLGLGWGTYSARNGWHFDLAASYGFQVFWDQNMFRQFVSATNTSASSSPNGNLYIQGLNITARLDF